MNQEMMLSKRILELNPDHAIMEKLKSLKADGSDDATGQLNDYIELIHGQALLAEGSQLKNPAKFTGLVTKLMVG